MLPYKSFTIHTAQGPDGRWKAWASGHFGAHVYRAVAATEKGAVAAVKAYLDANHPD